MIIVLNQVYAGNFYACNSTLELHKFDPTRSDCIINECLPQGDITDEMHYLQGLTKNACFGTMLIPCKNSKAIVLSSPDCKANTDFEIKNNTSNVIQKFYLEIQILIDSGSQITGSTVYYINNQTVTKGGLTDQFCQNNPTTYSMKQSFTMNVGSRQLNIKFQPNAGTSYQSYINGIFVAVQYCPDNCEQCNDDGCTQCSENYSVSNGKCILAQCDSTCQTCSGPGQDKCIICITNYKISDKNNYCVPSCDSDQFLDTSTSQQYCRSCMSHCQTCSSSNSCQKCQASYYYTGSSCSPCDNTCLSCSGPGQNQCIQCLNSNYYISEKLNNQCDSSCDLTQGQYIDNSNSNQQYCKNCVSFCKTCSNSASCQICMDNYYLAGNNCAPCDNSCRNCSGPQINQCTICKDSTYFISPEQNNQCIPSCDVNNGNYVDLQTNHQQKYCRKCLSSCKTCSNGNQCQSCFDKYFLDQTNQCQPCDPTCQQCNGPKNTDCQLCKSDLHMQLSTNLCVATCDSNEFLNAQSQCQKCDKSCKTCDGSTPNNCKTCYSNNYLFNKICVPVCPNGYSINTNTFTCDACQDNQNCNNCYKTCQLCTLAQIQSQQCNTCYSETRQLDSNNQCVCLNPNDKRNLFYQCSYRNIAVLNPTLSENIPQLIIEFGSPLTQIVSTPNQLCKQIFEDQTIALLGSDCSCQISGSQLIVNLTDSSNIMENDVVNLKSGVLQFQDYNVLIDTFYGNKVSQNATGYPLLQFQNNFIENTCNPITISLSDLKNDAGRGFFNITWSLEEINGITKDDQIQSINQAMKKASQNLIKILVLDPSNIPPNQNITIKFSYLLKVNKGGQQSFKIFYKKEKIIRINYQQSVYPPIYRYKSLSFYFQFYIESCEFGSNTYFNEPTDLKIVSPQLTQIEQNIKNYNQSSFQLNIAPYSLPQNQTLNMSLILNLSSNDNINSIKNVSIDVLISNLYLSIVGGSNFIVSYQKQFDLKSELIDYEIQDQNSLQGVTFTWQCKSLSNDDHVCYNYNHEEVLIKQGINSISFPERYFQPYSIIILTIYANKQARSANFSATCIFTELDIPPLSILSPSQQQNQKINLNQELDFTIQYDSNVSSDILSYAGALLYKNKIVGAIKFDYYQVKFRIWNYFQNIDPSNPTVQVRFSVYNPSYVMPSLSTISLQINIPPKNCILSISPTQGVALQTVFSIQFSNCVDEDSPLTYQFFYYNSQTDYETELNSPWNIARRLIKDQTTSYVINTILPEGNLVIMSQVMDSQLGISNSTSTVQVNRLNQTENDYCQLVDQIIKQSLQNSQSYNDQIVSLSIAGEDLSKNTQFQASQKIDDLKASLITNLQEQSIQLPQFSLLSTFSNKVIAQLQQTLTDSNQNQKSQIYNQIQSIIQNTQFSIQSKNASSLQQNNDIHMQNMIDSFKILNSTVNLGSSMLDFEHYNNISFQIGNMLSNSSLPNQGQLIIEGNLSSILTDTITQKNIYRYAMPFDDSDSQNSTNQFNIVRNTYQQNIYENTTSFQDYVKNFQNISSNFQYSKNKVIAITLNSTVSQNLKNNSKIAYQFDNAISNEKYNMTCLQQSKIKWSKKGCDIIISDSKNYMCMCKSQSPTTIIEDIADMFFSNKNIDTVIGEQGILNILNFREFYLYAAFWILTVFTALEIFLFILGRYLDKKTTTKMMFQVYPEEQVNKQSKDQEQQQQGNVQTLPNIQLANEDQQPRISPSTPPQTNQNIPSQLFQIDLLQKSPKEAHSTTSSQKTHKLLFTKQKRASFQHLQISEKFPKQSSLNSLSQNEIVLNQFQIAKQISNFDQNENQLNFLQIISQNEIKENQQKQEPTKGKYQEAFENISKFKKIALFHQFLSIFYLYDEKLSRSTRFTLFYIKNIHTLSISLLFSQYKETIQLIIIALINSLVLGLSTFFIQFTYKRGKFGKYMSIIFQIGLSLIYLYIILAISSGKSISESNDFMMIFAISMLTDLMFTQVILSFFLGFLVKKHFKNIQQNTFFEKLFNLFKLQQIIEMIDT